MTFVTLTDTPKGVVQVDMNLSMSGRVQPSTTTTGPEVGSAPHHHMGDTHHMNTTQITTSTSVRHIGDDVVRRISNVGTVPEGSDLSPVVTIERQDSDGDWLYAIAGPVSALVNAGYVFGDEATFSGTPAEVVAEPDSAQHLREELERTRVEADTLRHELTRANERVEEFRARNNALMTEGRIFTHKVTARLKEAVDNDEIERDDANSILDDLDCQRIASKYRVTVECRGTTVLVVEIEADDEDAAIDEVRDNVSASIQSVDITVEFEYMGDGEVDESDTYEDDDTDSVDADNYDLDFSAEEV